MNTKKHEKMQIKMRLDTKLISHSFVCCFVLFGVIGWFSVASATELFFEPESKELGVGQDFRVDLMLDPQEGEINASEGVIVFPEDLVDLKSIEDGGSILALWVERPSLKENTVSFAGIIPGGFAGMVGPWEGKRPGEILSLNAVAREEGVGEFRIEDAQVLLHDGKGTPAEVSISDFQFSIKEDVEVESVEPVPDTTPPEPFTPEVVQDPDLFEGNYFLVFHTTDKQSGIDYYEVAEKRPATKVHKIIGEPPLKWERTESPYVLRDQELKSFIYVKAVDRAGNERIEIVEPRFELEWYEKYENWVIIIITLIVVAYVIGKFLWKRYRKQH